MKTIILPSVLALFLTIVPLSLFSQNGYEDVVYLKNGTVIHGIIIEQVPNESIKIKTEADNIYFFQMKEIDKITKELATTSKKQSFGRRGFLEDLFYGVIVGINFSNLAPDGKVLCDEVATALNEEANFSDFKLDPTSRIGWQVGFSYNNRLYQNLFLQSALYIISKGFVMEGGGKYSTSYGSGNYTPVKIMEAMRLTYLQLPLYLKYYIFPKDKNPNVNAIESKVNPYILGGPSLSMVIIRQIYAKVTMDGKSNTNTQSIPSDLVNTFDVSLDFGGGVELFKRLILEFKYDLGMTNIIPSNSGGDNYTLKNRSFLISLGITFP